jgi:hypothetical protein
MSPTPATGQWLALGVEADLAKMAFHALPRAPDVMAILRGHN